MRKLLSSIVFAAALTMVSAPGYPFSLSQMLGTGESENLNTFKLIHVADLKALIAESRSAVHLFDANGATTREQFGTIPGATLLDSYDDYPLSVLPPDKHAKLVFYCANTH
jgi:hypothetical protein